MKKVYRSRRTKVLGGVAAGLAEYFDIDVTIMRLVFALLLVTNPNMIIGYVLAWIIIPEEPAEVATEPSPARPAGDAVERRDEHPGEAGMTADEIVKSRGLEAPPFGTHAAVNVDFQTTEESKAPGQETSPKASQADGSTDRNRQFFGFVLIAIGAVVLLKRFFPSFAWSLSLISRGWPVIIILAGIAIILNAVRGR
ncbi:MAG TPA: PspC domain-containing protein [Firmicutes bacterium]|nr:PspC domain-containing protein [Candidatus Fermentithermobacillaceae bacterium]